MHLLHGVLHILLPLSDLIKLVESDFTWLRWLHDLSHDPDVLTIVINITMPCLSRFLSKCTPGCLFHKIALSIYWHLTVTLVDLVIKLLIAMHYAELIVLLVRLASLGQIVRLIDTWIDAQVSQLLLYLQ